MEILDFIKLIKKYSYKKNSDQDIFDALFLCFDNENKVSRKGQAYGLDNPTINKIMKGERGIPLTYVNASKTISLQIIEENFKKNIIQNIEKDDIKRIKVEILNNFIDDNYFNKDEKSKLISMSQDDDSSSFLAYSFIKLLGKNNDIVKTLLVRCYANKKIENKLSYYDILERFNTVRTNIENSIKKLINEINEIHLPTKEKNINNLYGLSLPNFYETYTFDEDSKTLINTYAEKNNIKLSDNFFDLGDMEICKITTPFSAPEKHGTDEEKAKYSLLYTVTRNLKYYTSLCNFFNEEQIKYSLKLILENIGKIDDNNILVTLYFPKNSVYYHKDFYFDSENSFLAVFFSRLFDEELKIRETANIELCSHITNKPKLPHLNTDAFGRYSVEMEVANEANDDFDELHNYTLIQDDNYDVIKFEVLNIRKNSMCFFPTSILLREKPKQIKYEIKSNNVDGIISGVIK